MLAAAAVTAACLAAGCAGSDGRGAAGSGASVGPEPAPNADSLREQMLGMSDRLTAIYRNRDWPALDSLLAEDYLGSAPGLEWNRDSLRAEFPMIHLIGSTREGATVKWLAPGTALLNEDVKLRESFGGEDISGRYRWTTIWVRRGGGWKLAFEQELGIPAEAVPAKR
jgi:hypothetical protein